MGIPYSFYRNAGRLVSQVVFNAGKHVLECGTFPAPVAESRTVYYSQIFKRRQQWKNREIIRSSTPVDAVQLRLQDLVHHEMHSSISEMYVIQTNDG